jgi:hypothetical protein
VRADSTVRVDARDVVEELKSVLNVTAQSGFINPKPLIKRILDASGIDPAEVLVDPNPKAPEPPKISYSFKAEDLLNPVVLGIIVKAGHGLTPEELEKSKEMVAAMQAPSVGIPPPPAGQEPPGPTQNPEVPEKKFPEYEAAPRVNTRRAEN